MIETLVSLALEKYNPRQHCSVIWMIARSGSSGCLTNCIKADLPAYDWQCCGQWTWPHHCASRRGSGTGRVRLMPCDEHRTARQPSTRAKNKSRRTESACCFVDPCTEGAAKTYELAECPSKTTTYLTFLELSHHQLLKSNSIS